MWEIAYFLFQISAITVTIGPQKTINFGITTLIIIRLYGT